uniref:Uncharacterized protein n=1 Tax=Dechloromonas aromatica (strain RCB) TaxID=159087 RepID=Q47FJ3_DECAR
MHVGNSAIDRLINYFDHHNWPLDLSENKVRARASVEEDPSNADVEIVLIERHRAIFGCQYSPRLAMAAFQTYFICYSVSKEGKSVSLLPERNGPASYSPSAMADELLGVNGSHFHVEPLADGGYTIDEFNSGDNEVIESYEEAINFGRYRAESDLVPTILNIEEQGPSFGLTAHEIKALISDLTECAYAEFEQAIKEAWDRRNVRDDD